MNSSEQPDEELEEATPDSVFRTAIAFECGLGLLAMLLGATIGPDPRTFIPEVAGDLSQWATWRPIATGVGFGVLAAIPMLIVVAGILKLPLQAVRDLQKLTDDGMVAMLLKLSPLELVAISLCAGVGEELLFRGWLMYFLAGGTERIEWPLMMAGLVGSSILFGMVHPISKLYIALAAVMGIYFGGLLIWTENLLIPIVAHAAYDAVQLYMASREKAKEATALTADR